MRRTVSVEKLGHDPYFSDQENILLWAAVVEKKHCLFKHIEQNRFRHIACKNPVAGVPGAGIPGAVPNPQAKDIYRKITLARTSLAIIKNCNFQIWTH